MVTVAPIPRYTVIDFDNRGADCALWQTFFYLNWPAIPGNRRGLPNPTAKFGGPGATVWETFKTVEELFLAGGTKPPPWDPALQMTALAPGLAAEIASGKVRLLKRTSKISRTVIENIARNPQAVDNTFLDEIRQADGNILWDQQKIPVFYEIAMNKTQFDYIYNNTLFRQGRAEYVHPEIQHHPAEPVDRAQSRLEGSDRGRGCVRPVPCRRGVHLRSAAASGEGRPGRIACLHRGRR